MRILAIAGSLRSDSHNQRLLEAARRRIARGGANRLEWVEEGEGPVELELLDRKLIRELPHFDEDLEDDPPIAVRRLRAAVADADALLIATPEYNHSIPGVLKNAIDWLSRPSRSAALANKPAAVVGASTGRFGAVWAQAETRKVLTAAGARVLDDELALPQAHAGFDSGGALADPDLAESLDALVHRLAASARERELLAA